MREENMNQIYLLRFSYFYLSFFKEETSSIIRMVHFWIHYYCGVLLYNNNSTKATNSLRYLSPGVRDLQLSSLSL